MVNPCNVSFCRLLTTFANSLDPDLNQSNVGPDLDPNPFDTLIVFLEDFFFNLKSADDNKSMKHYPECKENLLIFTNPSKLIIDYMLKNKIKIP